MNEQIKYYQDKLSYEMDSSDLFDAMQKAEKVIVIDSRKAFAYEIEHIPNAINIPHREMNETTTNDLDKDTLYVVYCDGIGCNASTKGTLNMSKLSSSVKRHSDELLQIFPRHTVEEKRLFTILKDAYIEARYNSKFIVPKEDIDALIPKVELLRDITKHICEVKIGEYGEME